MGTDPSQPICDRFGYNYTLDIVCRYCLNYGQGIWTVYYETRARNSARGALFDEWYRPFVPFVEQQLVPYLRTEGY